MQNGEVPNLTGSALQQVNSSGQNSGANQPIAVGNSSSTNRMQVLNHRLKNRGGTHFFSSVFHILLISIFSRQY